MTLLRLERITSDDDTTVGALYLDDVFQCFTLEDQYQDEKVVKKTRIPAATYKIKLRDNGNMTKRYANKFPSMHRGMLWLQDVADFQWIYIHVGNTDKHTEGCILVGQGANIGHGNMSVMNSVRAYKDLYSKIVDAAEAQDLEIQIVDRDRSL